MDNFIIDPPAVGDAMRISPWTLRFPPALERQVEQDLGAQRSKNLVWRGYIGIAVFAAYLPVDFILTPDVFWLALLLRVGLVLPLAIGAILLLRRNVPPGLRETLVAGVSVLAAFSTLAIMLASTSELREGQRDAVMLVLLFLIVVERVQLPYALAAALVLVVSFVAGTFAMGGADLAQHLADCAIFVAATILTLTAGYTLEREARRSYLLTLRERQRAAAFETQSQHDPLTGLENRRALDDALSGLLPAPEGRQMAIILADIDHFKSYNDNLGHVAGDTCLRRIASLVAAEMRNERDRAVRFGGEEFLVLLPDADAHTASAIAERIRRAVEAAAIPHPGRPLQKIVTVSLGLAAGRIVDGRAADELVRGADAALYAAKAAGRNQVWPRVLLHDVVAFDRRSSGAA